MAENLSPGLVSKFPFMDAADPKKVICEATPGQFCIAVGPGTKLLPGQTGLIEKIANEIYFNCRHDCPVGRKVT